MKLPNTWIIVFSLGLAITSAHATDLDEFQHNVLFKPSTLQIEAETNGRVMIYDQLDNKTVELAMNTQFDRIENMMFVRTRYLQVDGSFEDADDCD